MSILEEPSASAGADTPVPLSLHHRFLSAFDQGDDSGPFGPRYHIVHGWRLRGRVDVAALQDALDDVVARHEALRTLIIRDPQGGRQQIFPPGSPELTVRDLPEPDPHSRDRRVEELLNEIESSTISARRPPLLRAVLGRFDEADSVLVLIVHHTAADGWSMRVIIRELAACYAARRDGAVADLPEVPQYREYAIWQEESLTPADVAASRDYWRDKLRGAQIATLPTDWPRSAGRSRETATHRFMIPKELVSRILEVSKAMRSSPFMILLAAYNVLVQRTTGATDIVVPTFTPGRGQERFQHTVGSFFNFLPLRTDVSGCATFRDVVGRTRSTCLEAYTNDIPAVHIFQEAPGLMIPAMQDGLAPCVFQVFLIPSVLDGELIGDLVYTEIRRRLVSQPVSSDIPDGALWTFNIDPSDDAMGSLQFTGGLFEEKRIGALAAEFRRVLERVVHAPDRLLEELWDAP